MTRTEAIAIITASLEAVDDGTLETAAAHLSGKSQAATMTAGDIVEAFATDSVLPRALSPRELALIEQAREDFRLGRVHTLEESEAYIDAELDRRRQARATA